MEGIESYLPEKSSMAGHPGRTCEGPAFKAFVWTV